MRVVLSRQMRSGPNSMTASKLDTHIIYPCWIINVDNSCDTIDIGYLMDNKIYIDTIILECDIQKNITNYILQLTRNKELNVKITTLNPLIGDILIDNKSLSDMLVEYSSVQKNISEELNYIM